MRRTLLPPAGRLPGLFDSTADELLIPDDLLSLNADEVRALHTQAIEAFNAIYGDGTGLTDEDFETLSGLTEQVERLSADIARRDEADDARQEQARELASRVNGGESPDEDDTATEPDADEDDTPDDGTEPDPAPVDPAPAPEAAAGSRAMRVNLRGRRQATPTNAPAQRGSRMAEFVTAAPDLPGYANGQGMDWSSIGRALDSRLRGFNPAQYAAAHRSGREMRQQFGVASIRRPISSDLMITGNDPNHVNSVFDRAVDESRLPGGSLVAAGGWCAPSEILYDLVELESRDGLYSLPEVGISRGGIQFTTGPNFAELYAGTGFSYSEAQDIAGSYAGGTNEVQRITVTGTPTGGTFTITYNGQTTEPLPYNATAAQVQAALLALSSVPSGTSIAVTGGPLPGAFVVITFQNQLGGLNVGQMTTTDSFTGGTSPASAVTTTTPGVAGTGSKPCYAVTCPEFTEARLNLTGLCISSGLLQQRGYPEMLARTTRGALIAHDHRVASQVIGEVVAGSDAVGMTASQIGATAPVLTAIELQTEHYRYVHRMARGTTLEAVFPYWVRGAIRSDLSRRLGVDLLDITDARINAWFTARGVNPQFIYNWQDITGTGASFIQWPENVSFLLYAAGTWVKGISDIITIDTIYDSVNLAQNEFTALFTEEGWLVAKRGFDSRIVTVPICADGATHVGVEIGCAGA